MSNDTYTVEMTRSAAKSIEFELKKEMAKLLTSIQRSRAIGEKPNVHSVERYCDFAQAVYAIVMARPNQKARYIDVIDMRVYSRDLYNYDAFDFEGERTVMEVVESLHETGSPAVVE